MHRIDMEVDTFKELLCSFLKSLEKKRKKNYVKKDGLFYFVLFTISTGKSISSTISNVNII